MTTFEIRCELDELKLQAKGIKDAVTFLVLSRLIELVEEINERAGELTDTDEFAR